MNYYERHLGDYARDAGHLSMLEHGAYTLLLDRYYATEAGIPADQVYRVARAKLKEEREAVELVLEEFFDLVDGVWTHGRCEEVIRRYQEGDTDRAAKAENERERKRRSRERRREIFETLRQRGIVPKWDAPMAELEAHLSRGQERDGPAPVTRTGTDQSHIYMGERGRAGDAPGTASQSPVPNPSPQESESASDTSPNSVRASLSVGAGTTRANGSERGGKGADLSEAEHHAQFERLKAAYPRFAGRQDWITVEHLCRQLVETGQATWDELIAAAVRYAKFCDAGGVSGPTFVLTPAKFYGAADKPWRQDWSVGTTEKPRDRALEAEWRRLEGEASRIGFRSRVGAETPDQFRAALKAYEKQQASKVVNALPGLSDALKMGGKAS